MTTAVSQPSHWLERWQSNGTSLNVKELLYYRRFPITPPYSKDQGRSAQQGAKRSAWRGRGMEFDEVRHYQPGDDIRAIDWRVTARTGKTHTKLFREEKERPVFVCVDFSRSMAFGSQLLLKSVFAAHTAAAIAWGAVKRGDRIGGLIFNDEVAREQKPQGRNQGVMQFIQLLHRCYPKAPSEQVKEHLNQQLKRLLKLVHPGSDVLILSDFSELNDDSIALLRGLKRHSAVTAIRISDPMEFILPKQADTQLLVQDGGFQGTLYLGSAPFREAYQAQADKWRQQQDLYFQQSGVKVIDLTAAEPLEQQWAVPRRRL